VFVGHGAVYSKEKDYDSDKAEGSSKRQDLDAAGINIHDGRSYVTINNASDFKKYLSQNSSMFRNYDKKAAPLMKIYIAACRSAQKVSEWAKSSEFKGYNIKWTAPNNRVKIDDGGIMTVTTTKIYDTKGHHIGNRQGKWEHFYSK
jgi:hypothetical protein